MSDSDRRKWVPWDPLVGLRVGAVTGAIIGAVFTAILGAGYAWLIIVIGFGGGALGYAYQRGRRPE